MHTSNGRQSLIWAHKQLQCWRLRLLVVLSGGCTVSPSVRTQCRLTTKLRLAARRGTAGGVAPGVCVMMMVSHGVWRMASCTCASSEARASSCCGSQALAGAGRDLGSLHEQTRISVGQKLLKSAGSPQQLCWSLVPSSLGKATGFAYRAGHCEPQLLPPYGSYW